MKTNNLDEHDAHFALEFSMWINNWVVDTKGVARAIANDHRALVQISFNFFLEFVKCLAEDYENGHYDERDKRACEKAQKIVEYLNLR